MKQPPRRVILVATNRSGSTFLNHALNNHPAIGWETGEPLTALRGNPDPVQCVEGVLAGLSGDVVGCKLSYRYLRDMLGFDGLRQITPWRIIHLYRSDAVRTTLSAVLSTMARQGQIEHPIQTTRPVPAARIQVDPAMFVGECLRYIGNVRSVKQALIDFGADTLTVTYADIMGGEGHEANQVDTPTAARLCAFLGVPAGELRSPLRRVNPQPAADIIENWDQVVDMLRPYEGDLDV